MCIRDSNYIHHLLFFLITVVAPLHCICGELTLFANAMEISTPVLNVMLVFRNVEGADGIATAAGVLFALLFYFARVFLFGWGLWRSLSFWWAAESAFGAGPHADLTGRVGAIAFLHGLLGGIYLLQLFWAKTIAGKFYSVIFGRDKLDKLD